MRRLVRLAASTLLPLAAAAGSFAQSAPPPDGVPTLSVQYADGRTVNSVVPTDRGRVSWTPFFPRLAGVATDREGLPLRALQFEEAIDGRALAVTVALLYGNPHQLRRPVTTVRLSDEQPVRVEALEAYGVKPVVLSLARLPSPQLVVPSVTSVSSQLDVRVETVAGAAPGYRLVVSNTSPLAVMSFAYRGYRGQTSVVSARPRDLARAPLIEPGMAYATDIRISAKAAEGETTAAWSTIDRFEVDTVTWSDGLVEGQSGLARSDGALDAGRARQLDRIVAILRAAAASPQSSPLAGVRGAIAALSIEPTPDDESVVLADLRDRPPSTFAAVRSPVRAGMQTAKNAILNDIDSYARAPGTEPYHQWLNSLSAKFDAWRTRLRQ